MALTLSGGRGGCFYWDDFRNPDGEKDYYKPSAATIWEDLDNLSESERAWPHKPECSGQGKTDPCNWGYDGISNLNPFLVERDVEECQDWGCKAHGCAWSAEKCESMSVAERHTLGILKGCENDNINDVTAVTEKVMKLAKRLLIKQRTLLKRQLKWHWMLLKQQLKRQRMLLKQQLKRQRMLLKQQLK